jgi:hypothetical protein
VLFQWRAWGEERIYFNDVKDHVRAVPAAWTSLRIEDPFVVIGGGRCFCRFSDLVELGAMIARLKGKV